MNKDDVLAVGPPEHRVSRDRDTGGHIRRFGKNRHPVAHLQDTGGIVNPEINRLRLTILGKTCADQAERDRRAAVAANRRVARNRLTAE